MAPSGCGAGRRNPTSVARRWRPAASWAAALAALAVAAGAAGAEQEAESQRRAAAELAPAPLVLPAPAEPRRSITEVKIRFYADDDYRAGLFRWADRTRTQLNFLNRVVEPAFGIRFEAESFRRWHRESGSSDIHKMVAELEKLDAGPGVDWVVAFVSALPLVSAAMHEVGAAEVLGRHFVLRGMGSAEEARSLGQAFDRLSPAEREQIYGERKWHKECAIFLHEWLHTLGALHSNDPQRITHSSYSNKMSNLAIVDAELAAVALQARLAGRASETIDWSPLLAQLEHASSPEWSTRERDELLALLRSTGARATGRGTRGPPGISGKDAEGSDADFNRAVTLLQDGKGSEAWAVARRLAERSSSSVDVQRLLCRLSFTPAAREEGLAACARAHELVPDSPQPLVDAAHARIMRKEPALALAAIDSAAALADKVPPGQQDAWPGIAQVYAQLGALTRAEQILARAGDKGAGVDAARLVLGQARRNFGVPRPPAAGSLAADRELAYAARHRQVAVLLDTGKLREARSAVDAGRREFPGVPGLEVLACEVEVRQHRPRPAEKACGQALTAMPDLARAHYLMAHVRLQFNARSAAVDELRRSIDLEPRASGTWETLAEVYRADGKRQELAALRAQYQKLFSRALP
jgi:predicted Zn-dependent protease